MDFVWGSFDVLSHDRKPRRPAAAAGVAGASRTAEDATGCPLGEVADNLAASQECTRSTLVHGEMARSLMDAGMQLSRATSSAASEGFMQLTRAPASQPPHTDGVASKESMDVVKARDWNRMYEFTQTRRAEDEQLREDVAALTDEVQRQIQAAVVLEEQNQCMKADLKNLAAENNVLRDLNVELRSVASKSENQIYSRS